MVYGPGVSGCPEWNVSRLDEGPNPWHFSYMMTVSTRLDVVLDVIEKGFAIWECCSGLRKLVFQNSLFVLLKIFNQWNSLKGMGNLIPYWRSSTVVISLPMFTRGEGFYPLLKIFNQCNIVFIVWRGWGIWSLVEHLYQRNEHVDEIGTRCKLGQVRVWANGAAWA